MTQTQVQFRLTKAEKEIYQLAAQRMNERMTEEVGCDMKFTLSDLIKLSLMQIMDRDDLVTFEERQQIFLAHKRSE